MIRNTAASIIGDIIPILLAFGILMMAQTNQGCFQSRLPKLDILLLADSTANVENVENHQKMLEFLAVFLRRSRFFEAIEEGISQLAMAQFTPEVVPNHGLILFKNVHRIRLVSNLIFLRRRLIINLFLLLGTQKTPRKVLKHWWQTILTLRLWNKESR